MRHSTKDNYLYLTTTPVPRLIVSLAVPTIISMLVTSFYNMADTYFVGRINTQSTAAVGIVFSVMSIIQAVGFFFGHGSGNYICGNSVRRRLGMQRRWRLPVSSGRCLWVYFWQWWDLSSLPRCRLHWVLHLLSCLIRKNIWASYCWVPLS